MRKTPGVSLRLTRPSAAELRSLADEGATDSLTYEPIGLAAMAAPPDGYRRDRWWRSLGRGDEVFDRAADALRNWRVHEGAGLIVQSAGPPAVGTIVAMAAPLPVGFAEAVCRVVDVVDHPDRCGFTYGTLSVHPQQGEESFTVVRSGEDTITFEIIAVSRPRQVLARAFPPVARRLQLAATNRYLTAMQHAVSG